MIDGFSFLQKDFLFPILLGGLLVFAVFVWKEWQTRKKGRFVLNSIIAFVTMLSLVLIIAEPTKEVEIQNQQGLLLTEGFSKKQQDSLKVVYKGIQELKYNPKKSIRTALDSLTSIVIIGNGVQSYDFHQLDSIPTAYLPNEIPNGVVQLDYTNQIVLGEELKVLARCHKPKSGSFLVLQDSRGNGLDSIQFEDQRNSNFSLTTIPKVVGNYVFQLSEKDSAGALVNSNPLPIKIRKKEAVSVLILNKFPTFETKYLKNFLVDAGYEVTVRSQLTKDKFKFEYFNTKASPVYQFTEESLKQFDVVIVDADTYFNLGNTVKNRFENSIREHGMGLFIQPSELLFNQNVNTSYFNFKRDGVKEIKLPQNKSTFEKYPYEFTEGILLNAITLDGASNVSVYKQLGIGRVATTTLLDSYQLLLKGEGEGYKRIWTQILDKIVKRKELAVQWESVTELPRVDEPYTFALRTSLDEISVINDAENRISLLQNSNISFKYSGITYPKEKGWTTLKVANDTTSQYEYYVYDANDWKTLSASKNIVSNAKQFGIDIKKNRTVVENRPISVLLFYILFLIGMGWLWLSPKLSAEG